MANELICSVCEQRIEPNDPALVAHGAPEQVHVTVEAMNAALDLGCFGKAVPKAPEPTGKRERWQLRVIATGEVVGTYVRRESVEDARHHAQRQPSEYEIIDLLSEPTGDD